MSMELAPANSLDSFGLSNYNVLHIGCLDFYVASVHVESGFKHIEIRVEYQGVQRLGRVVRAELEFRAEGTSPADIGLQLKQTLDSIVEQSK